MALQGLLCSVQGDALRAAAGERAGAGIHVMLLPEMSSGQHRGSVGGGGRAAGCCITAADLLSQWHVGRRGPCTRCALHSGGQHALGDPMHMLLEWQDSCN
jgi:hypothetical protein